MNPPDADLSVEENPVITSKVSYDDETLVWEGRPSQIVNLGTFAWWSALLAATGYVNLYWRGIQDQFSPVINTGVHWLLVILASVSVLSILYALLYVRYEYTAITKNKIKESRGITRIFQTDKYCEISDIKDIKSPAPGLLGLFGLSNLVIETNDHDQPVITIRAIRDRENLIRRLLPIWRELKIDRKGYFGDR